MSFRVMSALVLSALVAWSEGGASAQAFEKMDENWTVMVNGQSVRVEPDGSFTIPSVTAPDQFGAGGPGTPPDFRSDDFLRVIGISTADGRTRYAYSDRFQFRRGQQFSIGMMTITDTPPPFPQAIRIVSAPLVQVGQEIPLQVLGRLIDNSEIDVTTTGTTFRTSNLAIASVDGIGVVTAVGPGMVLLNAVNEGATATRLVQTTTSILQTTATGLVVDEMTRPVAGATVVCPNGQAAMTGANGSFQVPCTVAAEDETIFVTATGMVGGLTLTGRSEMVPIVLDEFTDVGFVVLRPFTTLTITFDAGVGSPPSYVESGMTIRSLVDHLHLGDWSGDGNPDLYNHANCCSTPYEFTLNGDAFNVIGMNVLPSGGSLNGTHTFVSSTGTQTLVPNVVGQFQFPAAGWQGITSFRWNATGDMVIDNLVIEIPASAR